MSLPVCSIQYPTCGACGGETEWDCDGICCKPCGLYYGKGEDQTEAEFLDETDEPCGKPCDNYWHGDEKITSKYRYECTACKLPEGHTSDHWSDCKPVRIGDETNE